MRTEESETMKTIVGNKVISYVSVMRVCEKCDYYKVYNKFIKIENVS
jgi:hypothetical protein